jgi:hypothetical protein
MIIKKMLPVLISLLILLSIGASAAATTSYNTTQISKAAGVVKTNVDTKNSLPPNVSVGNTTVTNPQFLYLLTTATKNVYNKNNSSVKLRNVSNPTSPSENVKSGTLTKAQYITMASSINSYISTNGRLPNYVNSALGEMKYESLIYMYSKILNYYNIYKSLPNTVSVKSWYSLTNPTSLGNPAHLNGTKVNQPTTLLDGTKFTSTLLSPKPTATSPNYVLKMGPFGNGTNKVAVIIGVHPLEVQTHIAMLNAIEAIHKSLTNVQIWVYCIVVTDKNSANYNLGRAEGQNLANKYVVPNIDKSFKLVLDTHGNTGNGLEEYSGYPNFIFAPNKDTISLSADYKIVASKYTAGDLINHYITGTSPAYVTIPIAKKGIPTIVYEQYINQANYAKVLYQHALQVVEAINAIFAK